MEEIKKSCTNCRHYVEHYVWSEYRFIVTNCGHCALLTFTKKSRIMLPLKNGCDKWENREAEIAEREKRIENELRRMVKQINKLIKYFEKEENV